ncbi:MAG: virulence factor [Sneathiella sp.]
MQVKIIYWRDIPSQVVAGKGRRTSKIMLSDRFQEAIDHAAMRDKAHNSDAYLEGWNKGDPASEEGTVVEVAKLKAEEIEAHFDEKMLNDLVLSGGWEAD